MSQASCKRQFINNKGYVIASHKKKSHRKKIGHRSECQGKKNNKTNKYLLNHHSNMETSFHLVTDHLLNTKTTHWDSPS